MKTISVNMTELENLGSMNRMFTFCLSFALLFFGVFLNEVVSNGLTSALVLPGIASLVLVILSVWLHSASKSTIATIRTESSGTE